MIIIIIIIVIIIIIIVMFSIFIAMTPTRYISQLKVHFPEIQLFYLYPISDRERKFFRI